MFEHRSHPLISKRQFIVRQLKFVFAAFLIVSVSLALGVWGYMHLAGQSFTNAFLNASMILGGMGPVDVLTNDSAKYFASCYALYSGIALLSTVAVILAPVLHRLQHALHLEDTQLTED